MRKVLSLLLVSVLLICAFSVPVKADDPWQPEDDLHHNYYYSSTGLLIVAGMPEYIKATFDYDRDFIEIVPDYPVIDNGWDYNGVGYTFPLATEKYGRLYNVSYTVDDTVITFEYRLKKGFSLDDYIDILDSQVSTPYSREPGALHKFPLIDVAMKKKVEVAARVVQCAFKDIVLDDGTVLYRDGEQKGTAYVQCWPLPLHNIAVTDPRNYKYIDKVMSSCSLDFTGFKSYNEVYEHLDASGEVDWVLIDAERVKTQFAAPRYYEFGNRVLQTEFTGTPFIFDMGVYSVKHGCCLDLDDPRIYELEDIEKVWTDIGKGRLIGDMDGDDELTVTDAALIQRCQAELADYPEDDVNEPDQDYFESPIKYFSDFCQDGERDVTDATMIQRFLADLPYRPLGWTPYPHSTEPEATEPEPVTEPPAEPETHPETQPEPTEPAPTEPEIPVTDIPQIIGFRSIGKGVEIHLSKVNGAEKYRVYYKNKNDNWVKMGETDNNIFIDDDVKVGTTYRYTVRCIKADLSEFTSDFDHTGWTYTYKPELDTPVFTGCDVSEKGMTIRWGAVDGADLYRVYKEDENLKMVKVADTRETSFTDADAQVGRNLYSVRCLSCKGKDFASKGFACIFYRDSDPVIESFTVEAQGMSLELYNSSRQKGNKTAVYRKNGSGKWQKIGETDSDSFFDENVQPGKTYCYTARNISSDGDHFTSLYDTTGWSHEYGVGEYKPKLGSAVNIGDRKTVLKVEDNKFDIAGYRFFISRFNMDTENLYSNTGTLTITNPELENYGDFFWVEIAGIGKNGDRITGISEDYKVLILEPASNMRCAKIGDRKYRFYWDTAVSGTSELVSKDGKYEITNPISSWRQFDLDLHDYPQDTEWLWTLTARSEDGVSQALPDTIEFRESDYS